MCCSALSERHSWKSCTQGLPSIPPCRISSLPLDRTDWARSSRPGTGCASPSYVASSGFRKVGLLQLYFPSVIPKGPTDRFGGDRSRSRCVSTIGTRRCHRRCERVFENFHLPPLEQRTIVSTLERGAESRPDKPAIIDPDVCLSYGELFD